MRGGRGRNLDRIRNLRLRDWKMRDTQLVCREWNSRDVHDRRVSRPRIALLNGMDHIAVPINLVTRLNLYIQHHYQPQAKYTR